MPKIFKYPLLREPEQDMLLPLDFVPLKVERVGTDFFLWGIVGTALTPTLRRISLVGSGWEHDFDGQMYIGTMFDLSGGVWHVFIDEARKTPR